MTDQRGLRVGFVGTGWTDRVQIPVFRMGGLMPQAICSGNVANAERVAAAHQLPEVFDDWHSLVTANSVDIVSIATPPDLHLEIAQAALAAGKHVIAEKPTARNVDEAEAMLAAAQAAPDQMAIIDHELRFHPARLQLRQLIKNGHIGSVLSIRLDRLGADRLNPTAPWSWFSNAEQGGGMLGALGSHLLDQARWLVGRIDNLTAQLTTAHLYRVDPATGEERPVTADDHAEIMIHFANGVHGTITVSGMTPGGYGMSIDVIGTRGALRLDNEDQLWSMRDDEVGAGTWQPVRVKYPGLNREELPNNSPFTVGSFYLAQTVAASLSMGEVMLADAASFYDGLVVQRALDAARLAHAEKTWVRL